MRMRGSQIDAQVRERLSQLTADWVPQPAPGNGGGMDPTVPADLAQEPSKRRWMWQPDFRAMRAIVVVLVVLVLVAGWNWWQGQPRDVIALDGSEEVGVVVTDGGVGATGVTGEVVVHVAGSVGTPGLVRLPAGSRVADAIEAAGGARGAKVLESVNLARPLVDGEQIVVGVPRGDAQAGVSINNASAAELEALPGIGPVLAQRIVAWREANGPFRSIDELSEVSGIGDALMAQLRGAVRV